MLQGIRCAAVLGLALILAACGGTASVSPTPSASSSPSIGSPSPVASPPLQVGTSAPSASGASASPSAKASAGPVHACALLTDAEASQVNGATYGPGVEHAGASGAVPGSETSPPPSSLCVWQNAAPIASVTVEVVIDANADAANARLAALRASLASFSITDLTDFADGGFIARSTNILATGGIYVREGTTFLDIVYLLGTAPDDNALRHAATLALGRLP
jgi:hypothetical protein